jgi:hypothetical protein
LIRFEKSVIQKGSRAQGGRSKGTGPKAKECAARYAKGERDRVKKGGDEVEVEVRKQGNEGGEQFCDNEVQDFGIRMRANCEGRSN